LAVAADTAVLVVAAATVATRERTPMAQAKAAPAITVAKAALAEMVAVAAERGAVQAETAVRRSAWHWSPAQR
jgi:hypothetical protein